MMTRQELFPGVLEMNVQARQRLGCCVYLIYEGNDWMLIDIGFEDTVDQIVEMIRQMDFPLSSCRYLVATHADVDHVQGMKRAKELLPSAKTVGHPDAVRLMKTGDPIVTFAEISAQDISIPMPAIELEEAINEGDELVLGERKLEVWHTPGHTHGQLAFRMGELLFSGDNIYRDGGVGNIDAHHGSDIPDFIKSLERIRDSDVEWLLPSHGPAFRKDPDFVQKTIDRLKTYLVMADFGTCAIDWPLMHEWDEELEKGVLPDAN